MAKVEEEVALLCRGDNPAVTASDVSHLDKFDDGRFVLLPQPTIKIVDTYYDTYYGAIRGAKSSMRIRHSTQADKLTTFVTIKGGNFSTGTGQKRIEQEVEWPFDVKPEEVFKLFELEPIQRRVNWRKPREVFDNTLNEVIAELVVDNLNYEFKDRQARLYEIEIERTSDNVDADIYDVANALLKKYPNRLKLWKHSKLGMGKIIELALQVQTDKHGLIKDSSFDAIDSLLR